MQIVILSYAKIVIFTKETLSRTDIIQIVFSTLFCQVHMCWSNKHIVHVTQHTQEYNPYKPSGHETPEFREMSSDQSTPQGNWPRIMFLWNVQLTPNVGVMALRPDPQGLRPGASFSQRVVVSSAIGLSEAFKTMNLQK